MFLDLAHTKTDLFLQSKNLLLECYRVTKLFPSEEKFSMVQQVRRAGLSVHLNVAEGCSGKSAIERKRFFEVSRGSVIEIDTAIDFATKLEYCDRKSLEVLGNLIVTCFKQLSGLIKASEKP